MAANVPAMPAHVSLAERQFIFNVAFRASRLGDLRVIHSCMYVCMYVCTYVYTYTNIYIYIYIIYIYICRWQCCKPWGGGVLLGSLFQGTVLCIHHII